MEQSLAKRIASVLQRLSSADSPEAEEAVYELECLGDAAIPEMIRFLGDPHVNARVRCQLMDFIASAKQKKYAVPAIPELVRLLDPEMAGSECARSASSALSRIGEPSVDPLLAWAHGRDLILRTRLGEMFMDSNADMRVHVLRCYRRCQLLPPVDIRAEIDVLQDDVQPPYLRRQAAATSLFFSLWTDSDRRIAIIREGLQDSEDPHQAEYLEAIKRHGTQASILAPSIEPFLQSDHLLCQLAIKTYGAIGGASHEAIMRIQTCLETSPDKEVRQAAALTLGPIALSNSHALAALSRALEDQDKYVQQQACRMLGRAGRQAAGWIAQIEALARLGPCVPGALANIGTPEAIAALWRVYNVGRGEDGDRARRMDQQLLYECARAELRNLGEIKAPEE